MPQPNFTMPSSQIRAALHFVTLFTACTASSLLSACAHAPTTELSLAQRAYYELASSDAPQHVPGAVQKAEKALARADRAHARGASLDRVRDLAYIAHQRTRIARGLHSLSAPTSEGSDDAPPPIPQRTATELAAPQLSPSATEFGARYPTRQYRGAYEQVHSAPPSGGSQSDEAHSSPSLHAHSECTCNVHHLERFPTWMP